MKATKNILTEKELEFVNLLMQDCTSTGDIQSKLKRLFAGAIEQMLEVEMDEQKTTLGRFTVPKFRRH